MGALRRWKPNVEKVIANDKIPYFGAVDKIISYDQISRRRK
jgi:hypothetical protein